MATFAPWMRSAVPLAVVDLRVRYAGTWLGGLWSVLVPLLEVAAYALLFGVLLGAREVDGIPFTLYVAAGLLPWSALRESLELSAACLTEHRWIRRSKVPFELLVARHTLSTAVRAVVGVAVVIAAAALAGGRVSLLWLAPVLALLAQLLTAFGLGQALAPAAVMRPDLRPALASLLTFLTFASPVVYPESLLPPWLAAIVELNPFTHMLRLYRAPLGPGETPLLISALVTLTTPAAALALGAGARARLWWPARDRL